MMTTEGGDAAAAEDKESIRIPCNVFWSAIPHAIRRLFMQPLSVAIRGRVRMQKNKNRTPGCPCLRLNRTAIGSGTFERRIMGKSFLISMSDLLAQGGGVVSKKTMRTNWRCFMGRSARGPQIYANIPRFVFWIIERPSIPQIFRPAYGRIKV